LVLAGRYVFLARRRVLRWLAFGLLILAPVMVLVIFARHHILWVGVVSLVLVALAIVTTRLPSSGPDPNEDPAFCLFRANGFANGSL